MGITLNKPNMQPLLTESEFEKIAKVRRSISRLEYELTKPPPNIGKRSPQRQYRSSGKPAPRFPVKVAQLADDFGHRDFVRWSRPSWVLAFHTVNFEDQFLRSGRFYKFPISTCHWASFVRQLNSHGFRKLRAKKKSPWVFYQRVDENGF